MSSPSSHLHRNSGLRHNHCSYSIHFPASNHPVLMPANTVHHMQSAAVLLHTMETCGLNLLGALYIKPKAENCRGNTTEVLSLMVVNTFIGCVSCATKTIRWRQRIWDSEESLEKTKSSEHDRIQILMMYALQKVGVDYVGGHWSQYQNIKNLQLHV